MKIYRRILRVVFAVCLLFVLLIAYLTYFEFFVKERIISNPYNRRLSEDNESVLRGSIYDRNGVLLAESRKKGDTQERSYPHDNLYSHIIGYNSRIYGKSLLEANYNDYLSNKYEIHRLMEVIDRMAGYEPSGAGLFLTIDHELQKKAGQLMGQLKGAIVAMDPKTGEILAMVSKPDFNPNNNNLEKNWSSLVESPDAVLMPRATQGLYPPGSTYKVIISAAAIENGLADFSIEDKGSITIDGKEFRNSGGKAYGKIDMKKALAVSSNVYYAKMGSKLGQEILKTSSEVFGLNKSISFELPLNKSSFPYKEMSETDLASVGIGQGKILVTPLHMAMIASCIANEGILMKPWLVKRIETVSGIVLQEGAPVEIGSPVLKDTAGILKEMMVEVVENGTGDKARIKGVKVAGKTGTAQNESLEKGKGKDHAWFIGFAPADDPQIAVAIIAEYSGSSGGDLCAPIAKQLIKAYMDAQ